MFSFIPVKRKTTDSEFKYCCGDYQLYKPNRERERESYTKLFPSSQLKKNPYEIIFSPIIARLWLERKNLAYE